MYRSLFALILASIVLVTASVRAQTILSLEVRNVDIYTVVDMLAKESGRNIVIDNVSVKHDKITLRLKNVDFETALHTIELSDGLQDAREGSIIYLGSADAMLRRYANDAVGDIHTETFRLRNASVDELTTALTAALPPATPIIADERTRSILITASQATLDRARMVLAQLDAPLSGDGSNGGLITKLFPLRYIPAICDQNMMAPSGLSLAGGSPGTGMMSGTGAGTSCTGDALSALKAAVTITAPNSIVASSQRNAIIATGTPDFIQSLTPIIDDLDQPAQQVLYEVRVVDLEPVNDQENLGLEFGGYDLNGNALSGSATTAFINPSIKINAQINAMLSHGNGHTLATPRLVVLNNHTGDLLVGETLPLPYVNAQTNALQAQFINIGVLLALTPIVGADGDVTTDIHPEFSSLIGLNTQGLPSYTDRKIDTVLRVKSGESIVIAGLIQDIFTQQVGSVPLFSDIPVVGGLFKNKEETHTHDEVVFIITPHIMTDDDVVAPDQLPGLSTPPLPTRK